MSVSSSSATVAVEKATSDLLMGPDWTMNIEICDSINSNHWQPKDVVKAVKKRLQHKSSKVQLLALTLVETMVKNCGEYVHFQIADRSILEEMIKIVRKKSDMQVRQKILVLLDSWQEAFGGPNGKYPQYYWAYDELKRSGVVFPKRSLDAAPIFTPPIHSASRSLHPGYGMSSGSSKTLDETMATEIESLSLSSLDSMRHVMDLLSDMLQAVNPSDRAAVKDEVIVDLVDRCRTNQKKLMQMLTTTGDEELLGRGLELNDSIQSLLARHDSIASGTPLPIQVASSSTRSPEVYTEDHSSVNETDVKSSSPVESDATPKASPLTVVCSETRGLSDEEEEDEFAQLARRHSRALSVTSRDATAVSGEDSVLLNANSPMSHVPDPETTIPSNALALPNPPAPVSTSKDQDIIDLLSITLSLAPSSPPSTYPQSASSQGMQQMPAPSRTEGYSYAPQTYPGNSQYNSYVVPWAQPQSQSQSQPQLQQQQQKMYHPQSQQQTYQPQSQQHMYQPQSQQHMYQPQSRSQFQQHMHQPQPQSQSQQQMYQQQSPSRSQPATPPSPQQLNAHYGFEQSLHHQHSQQFQAQPQAEQQLQSQPQSPMQTQHPQYSPQQQLQHHETQQFQYQTQPQPQQHLQSQHQPKQNMQPQPQPHSQLQSRPQQQPQQQVQPQQQLQQSQPQPPHVQQPQPQPQFQNQHPQYPARYPPPPWAATPGYPNYQNQMSATNMFSTHQANTTGPYTAQGPYTARGFSGPTTGGDPRANPGPRNPTSSTGQKTFVPSYRLFEDLNVFGNTDGKVKMTSSGSSSSLSGTMGPGMVGGRK